MTVTVNLTLCILAHQMSELQSKSVLYMPSGIRSFLCILFFVAALNYSGSPVKASTSPQGAAQFIQWLGDQAISTLGSTSSPLAQREATVRQLMRQGFDLEFIGRFVLGRHWRTVSADQQAQYLDLFSSYILQTYSSHLGGLYRRNPRYNRRKIGWIQGRHRANPHRAPERPTHRR